MNVFCDYKELKFASQVDVILIHLYLCRKTFSLAKYWSRGSISTDRCSCETFGFDPKIWIDQKF